MSARRLATEQGDASFDHGAQYFTARDAGFRRQVSSWQQAGCAAPWPAAGSEAWVGVPAMNAPVKALAAGLDVHWNAPVSGLRRLDGVWTLDGVNHEPDFDAAVVAIPAEQAAILLAPVVPEMGARAEATRSAPCWTAMAAFAEPVRCAADVLRGGPVLNWAARNSAKPGRCGPESWVMHAAPDWSREKLERSPPEIVPLLLQALASQTGVALPPVLVSAAHRWRYAMSGASGEGCLWSVGTALGVCGDWLVGPRVESAWLSGIRLAAAMIG